MNTIHFYNSERQLEMTFSDFRVQRNRPDFNDFVSFQVNVQHGIVRASFNTECLDIDLVNFNLSLQKLYKTEVTTASFFQTIEKNIKITFNQNEFGEIIVRVTIQNQIENTILDFAYGTDQSFLPELIQEIEAIIQC